MKIARYNHLRKFGKKGKPQYLKISNILKQMCHSISLLNKLMIVAYKKSLNSLEIKPPLAVNLDYIHNSGDVDGWSILRPSAEGKLRTLLNEGYIRFSRDDAIVYSTTHSIQNRDKSFGSLRFIFEDLNQITDQSKKCLDWFQGNQTDSKQDYRYECIEIKQILPSVSKSSQLVTRPAIPRSAMVVQPYKSK